MKSTELRKISIENSKELVPKIIKDCLWAAEHGMSEKIFDCSLNGFTKEHERNLVKLGYKVEWISRYEIRVSWAKRYSPLRMLIRIPIILTAFISLVTMHNDSWGFLFLYIGGLVMYFMTYDESKLLAK